MTKFRIVYIVTSSKKEAKKISEILVKEKLAACINFFPITSVYKWQGKIEKEKEFGLIIKTKKNLVEKVIKRVKGLHSYEVPCIISLPVEKGYKKFLEWIDESTKQKEN